MEKSEVTGTWKRATWPSENSRGMSSLPDTLLAVLELKKISGTHKSLTFTPFSGIPKRQGDSPTNKILMRPFQVAKIKVYLGGCRGVL